MKVELESDVWLADGEGDPARTLDESKAKNFRTLKEACAAIIAARRFRLFRNAAIVSEPKGRKKKVAVRV
jgi:hypothetical protein